MPLQKVIVCQIGAREHYSIAKAMQQSHRLSALVTDLWVAPRSTSARLAPFFGARTRKFSERYSDDLSDAKVLSPGLTGLFLNYVKQASRSKGWAGIMAHNQWFGAWASKALESSGLETASSELPAVFAYSYAAKEIFRWAKSRGMRTVLGQIDPGPEEVRLVQSVSERHRQPIPENDLPPAEYWERWREECSLADTIIVNSRWSRCLVEKEIGLGANIKVVPLIYDSPDNALSEPKDYSGLYDGKRPLNVLFLGQVNIRKGAIELINAMEQVKNLPIKLTLVGPIERGLEALFEKVLPNVEVVGPVSRSETTKYYATSDLMILPTHSDGFAITQLEAQAFGLPLIVSRSCGDVVTHGSNGWVMKDISTESIVAAFTHIVENDEALSRMSADALTKVSDFSARALHTRLEAAIDGL